MKVQVSKCTQSINGGFVATITAEPISVKTALGNSLVKPRFLFKSEEDITGLETIIDLEDFNVVALESVDEATGKKFTNNWLMPKVS